LPRLRCLQCKATTAALEDGRGSGFERRMLGLAAVKSRGWKAAPTWLSCVGGAFWGRRFGLRPSSEAVVQGDAGVAVAAGTGLVEAAAERVQPHVRRVRLVEQVVDADER